MEMKTGSTILGANTGLAEMLVDSNIDGLISINQDWQVTAWNHSADAMMGRSRKTVFGKHLLEAIPSLSKDEEALQAIRQSFRGVKVFVPASDLFDHRRHLENYYIPLADRDRGVIGVMNIIHDVAHRIKAEMQLQGLNRELENRYRQLLSTSSELANFTLISSHNIKDPIRTLYTAIEYMIKTESRHLSNNGKATFRRMQSSLNKMNLLLDDMLSLTRISILEKPVETVELRPVIETAILQLNARIKEKNAEVILEGDGIIIAHQQQVQQLVYQLIDNGIKFNESDQPRVTITCGKADNDMPPAADPGKEYFCIRVTDNGIGIEAEAAPRIFNMFEKLHPESHHRGSGMGLAIAQKIMQAHEGYINVSSSPGKGASFACFFPAR